MTRMIGWMAALGMLLAVSSASAGDGFKIVVNDKNGVSSLSRSDISAMLLKKKPRWSDGTAVTVVDQRATSAVRETVSKDICGKSAAAVKSYWNQQVFSGRDVPPVEKESDAEVLAFVRANPGAIGYISEVALTTGVKVVAVQ